MRLVKKELREANMEIEILNKKIKSFSKGTMDVSFQTCFINVQISAKKEIKTSELTNELLTREKELQQQKLKNFDQEEEMRKLCLQNQKFSAERLHLLTELKAAEKELAELRSQNEG